MRQHAVRLLLAAGLITVGGAAFAGPEDEAPPARPVASLPATSEVAAKVDALMASGWSAAKVTPRGPSTDAEFLRRLSLDVTGAIPDEAVVRAFLASEAPDKRARAIRDALQSDGYARSMAMRWSYLLVGREFLLRSMQYRALERMVKAGEARREGQGMEPMGPSMGGGDMSDAPYDGPVPPLVEWLEGKLASNTPWDQVTRELLTADGSAAENPATHYALRYLTKGETASELAGSAMRVFQGLQIQCAQCHDHPYTQWTQQDFWGVAAFFSRTTARREPPPDGDKRKQGPFIISDRDNGQIRIPAPPGEVGRLVLPRFLTGEVIRPGAGVDRRAELARLVTAPSNPYFARATVNRVWSYFFGRGIVHPVDDLETKDHPHPKVLDLLVADFKASGHDLRRLSEVILLTRAYQATSVGPEEGRDAELAQFARAPLRSLSAEQIFYSVLSATGVEDVRTSDRRARQRIERIKVQVLRKFLQTFGDDEAQEVVDEGTIPQALLLLNGPLSNDAVRPRPDHPVYERLFRMKSHDERIETVYLRVLGRQPEPAERQALRDALSTPEGKTAAGQAQLFADIYWALLNSPEFVLNH